MAAVEFARPPPCSLLPSTHKRRIRSNSTLGRWEWQLWRRRHSSISHQHQRTSTSKFFIFSAPAYLMMTTTISPLPTMTIPALALSNDDAVFSIAQQRHPLGLIFCSMTITTAAILVSTLFDDNDDPSAPHDDENGSHTQPSFVQ